MYLKTISQHGPFNIFISLFYPSVIMVSHYFWQFEYQGDQPNVRHSLSQKLSTFFWIYFLARFKKEKAQQFKITIVFCHYFLEGKRLFIFFYVNLYWKFHKYILLGIGLISFSVNVFNFCQRLTTYFTFKFDYLSRDRLKDLHLPLSTSTSAVAMQWMFINLIRVLDSRRLVTRNKGYWWG